MKVNPLSYSNSTNGIYIRARNKTNDVIILANFDNELAEVKNFKKTGENINLFLENVEKRLFAQYDFKLI